MQKISFIYCFKDRELLRVKLSLDSLAAQTDSDFNVIFVDYGSEPALASQVESLVLQYPFARYIYNNTRGMMWNRSHALNTAIRIAESPYLFTSDIDMIFNPGFVSMLKGILNPNKAFYFAAIMLPENTLPGNPEKEKKYEQSKDNALGWFLIPREKLIAINGYDEVYCIWGKEDNDIGHRLRFAGVEVKFIREIWMYHYYHPPVPNQRSVLPEDWFYFLMNYYDHSIHKLKRNEGHDWGLCLVDNERPALKILNQPLEGFVPLSGRCRFFRYVVEQTFSDAGPSQILKFVYTDKIADNYRKSNLFRFSGRFNRFLRRLKIPFQVSSIYEHAFEDIYFARNELMYFLVTNKEHVLDFAYDLKGDTLKLVVIKK